MPKQNLEQFYPLLIQPLKDFEEGEHNTNNRLNLVLADIADSSTINFIVKQYPALKEEQKKLQYSLLELLLLMKQPAATQAVEKLFVSSKAPAGYASKFVQQLTDTLPFAKAIFPRS